MLTTNPTKQTPRKNSHPAEETKIKQDVREKLDKFFGCSPYEAEWGRAGGNRLGVIISYTDFFSEHLVKQMLADILSPDIHVVLKREYSDQAIARLLLQEYKKNRIAVVDCYDGELRPETVRAFVSRKLDGVEMIG